MSTTRTVPAVYDLSVTYKLHPLTCSECGILFGLENGYDDRRREDQRTFYCPNGHSQHYPGKTKTQRLQEQLDAARSLAQREATWRREAEARTETERRSAAAYKGHVTRIRNRIANGVCPAGCNRHFDNVERHIASKHPDFKIPKAADSA
jgi:hypothetical protein